MRDPENPLRLVRVIDDIAEEPCWIVSEVGFGVIEKFGVEAAWTMKLPVMV